MSDEVRYVRLRPFDERAGHVRRDQSIRFEGRFFRFKYPGVWVKVPTGLAVELAKLRQVDQNPKSPSVFDVKTEGQARSIEAKEKADRDAIKARIEPTVDTAEDFTEMGRGDLGIEEVTGARERAMADADARANALVAAEARASGEMEASIPDRFLPDEVSEPEPAPKAAKAQPKKKAKAKAKAKAKRSRK